jgi:hypothetical protein
MASICDWCRENLFEDKGHYTGFIKIKGSCELCESTDICNDLASYQCKKDWQNILDNQTDWKRIT